MASNRQQGCQISSPSSSVSRLLLLSRFSRVHLFATPWPAAHQASLSFTVSQGLLKLMSLYQWCHPTISSSLSPFSSCLQSLPASESFPMSWLFASGGRRIGASPSASVLPMNIQGWCPLWLTGLISLLSKGLSRVLSITIWKHQFLSIQPSLWSNSHIHIYWKNHTGKTMVFPYWKNHSFDYMDLCRQSDASAFEYTI